MAYQSKYTGAEVDALLDKIKDDDVGNIDSSLSTTSENPVMNKVITAELNKKATETALSSLEAKVNENKTATDTALLGLSTKVDEEVEALQTQLDSNGVLIEDLQNSKIDKEADDYYPQLSVGLADNLAGTEYTESEIGFRRSGGGAILDGNARVSSVKGNSVVWNQVVKPTTSSKEANGVHIISQGDGSFKVYTDDAGATAETSISSINIYLLPNHKYAVFGTPQQSGSVQYYIWWTGLAASENGGGLIKTYSGSGDASYWSMVIKAGTVIPQSSPLIFRPRAVDLTLMFGAGNEPTTIEEFYARKPKVADENAYNEGEVIHMEADAIKSVGVNQWDEEWEGGSLSTITGLPSTATSAIRAKDFIKVLPSSDYYVTAPTEIQDNIRLYFYDADKNFIERGFDINRVFATLSNAHYMKLIVNNTTTHNNDICINLSDTEVNGKYFPYVKREQTLEMLKKYFPNGMKSAGTAHDEIRWNEQKQKWEAIKRIGEVKMKDLSWAVDNGTPTFRAALTGIIDVKYGFNIRYKRYATATSNYAEEINDKEIALTNSAAYTLLRLRDSSYTTVEVFVASLTDNDILYYELAEPIVTEIDENFNLDYEVWNAGTEQMIADTPSTPIKASIAYGFNAVGKIKQLEEIIAQLRAKVGI